MKRERKMEGRRRCARASAGEREKEAASTPTLSSLSLTMAAKTRRADFHWRPLERAEIRAEKVMAST